MSGDSGQKFNARDEQSREVMLSAIAFFDRYLWNVTGGRQDKVRMLDAIFSAISHPNDERVKGNCP